jgi:hypothetical protein
MGTFHRGKDPLHGITVVVDTTGPEVYVGRCDDIVGGDVVLLDVDVHRDGEGAVSKQQWVSRAARFGGWKKLDSIVIPKDQVASIRRLGDIEAS